MLKMIGVVHLWSFDINKFSRTYSLIVRFLVYLEKYFFSNFWYFEFSRQVLLPCQQSWSNQNKSDFLNFLQFFEKNEFLHFPFIIEGKPEQFFLRPNVDNISFVQFLAIMESGSSPAPKRGLQDLSKDELIQKCKGLLNLAQKAKQAKDGMFWLLSFIWVCFLSLLFIVFGAGFWRITMGIFTLANLMLCE